MRPVGLPFEAKSDGEIAKYQEQVSILAKAVADYRNSIAKELARIKAGWG